MPVNTGIYTETLLWHDEKFEKYAARFAFILITKSFQIESPCVKEMCGMQ